MGGPVLVEIEHKGRKKLVPETTAATVERAAAEAARRAKAVTAATRREAALLAAHGSIGYKAIKMLNGVKGRARKLGRAFDLTSDWLEPRLAAGVCEATGLPLVFGRELGPWSPSVDRKDSAGGYTKENCHVVCWAYNCAKGPWADDVLLLLARAVVERSEGYC